MLYREQKYDFIRVFANYFLESRLIEPRTKTDRTKTLKMEN